MDTDIAYIPGRPRKKPLLLNRFLPPLPEGIVSTWLRSNLPQGSWVIDPFGVSPQLALEAAQSGYRILVIAKNPIIQFLLKLHADPPKKAELQTALATLATTRIGTNRLEPYINNQYLTECNQCGQEIHAEAFVWERESSSPYARIYRCPNCKDTGEHYVNVDDATRASQYLTTGIYRIRAIERIISSTDQDRPHVEEAINSYLPRALHNLVTLINKLEGFTETNSTDPQIQSSLQLHLAGLMLHAFDRANTLWTYPTARERPRKLTIPPKFLENNIWSALEEAVNLIASTEKAVTLTHYPDTPPESGGVTIFSGTLKELGEIFDTFEESRIKFDGVVTTFPRPNQAFWTLSTLWAGWLWGKEHIQQYKHVFRRRRYDWSWHSNALNQVLKNLSVMLPNNNHFLGLICEVEPGFLTSALVASVYAGFNIQSLSLRADQEIAQLIMNLEDQINQPNDESAYPQLVSRIIEDTSLRYIYARGEPVEYIQLCAAGLFPLMKNHSGIFDAELSTAEKYNFFHEKLESVFSVSKAYKRYGSSEKSLSVGQWWVTDDDPDIIQQIPLADRVEEFIIQYLQENTFSTLPTLDKVVCDSFRGLFTPDYNFIKECLESYCDPDSIKSGYAKIRTQDLPEVRQIGVMSMRSSLKMIGISLGFSIENEQPIIWREISGELAYVFYILTNAAFGRIIFTNPFPAKHSFIVIPGSRSHLTTYKLKHNSRLRIETETGWRFLKFRHIRRLVDAQVINRENLIEQLEIDPLSEDDPQLRLL